MTELSRKLAEQLAGEISARPNQVEAAVRLLDDGATVPFIARYRKEVTGALTDDQLRLLEERLVYCRELEERRRAVIEAISRQGKLNDELLKQLESVDTKQQLEDLYAPYKSKRRTRAMAAREAGLEPLADAVLAHRECDPEAVAAAYVDAGKGVADAAAALAGARDILAERFSLDAPLRETLRALYEKRGFVASRAALASGETPSEEAEKFRDYFEYRESFDKVPSHRALALLRGQRDGFLQLSLELRPEDEALSPHPAERLIAERFQIANTGRKADDWLLGVCRWTWRVKCRAPLETDLLEALRLRAEEVAIGVFGDNLRDLLLAAPAGHHCVVGLDPGFRTGVKLAVIDATGRVKGHDVLMMHSGAGAQAGAKAKLADILKRESPDFIAIGNGTASRETAGVVGDVLREHHDLKARRVIVSEAGASVYSASALAAAELPDLDVSYRGAVSIARRLQDPLAELVKIDPKAIGVGQYQHDVDHAKLERRLNAVVEDCVNFVGVDVNTASAELLSYVAGLTKRTAAEVVKYRESRGPFRTRKALLDVPFFGPVRYEQAAGFLRIPKGDDPLDATGVHPESYSVVERILKKTGLADISELMGNEALLRKLRPADFADEHFGVPTVADILKELEKPGRDPRSEFRTAVFDDAVQTIEDLRPGMKLEGVVSNVAAFGAFVDIGVHNDGLVHVSELSDRFVKDPREVVKVGDVVEVTVLDVDLKRGRVALSMRSGAARGQPGARRVEQSGDRRNRRDRDSRDSSRSTAMSAAFAKLKR